MSRFDDVVAKMQSKFDDTFSSRTVIIQKQRVHLAETATAGKETAIVKGIVTYSLGTEGLSFGDTKLGIELAANRVEVSYDANKLAYIGGWPKKDWIIKDLDRERTYRVLYSEYDGKHRVKVHCVMDG